MSVLGGVRGRAVAENGLG